MKNLWCKLGWHRPLTNHKYLFTDVVSGLPVYSCLCSCGKEWMCDSLKPFGGFKVKLEKSNEKSYQPEDE